MRTLFRALGIAALVATAAAPFVAAEDTSGRNIDLHAFGERKGTATLALAHALYRRGLADGDALTVLTAARLAAGVQSRPGDVTAVRTGNPAAADDADATEPDGPPSAEEMFAAASDLAGGDPALDALIADAMAETPRGRGCCSTQYESRLPAGLQETWEFTFQAEKLAEIVIIGDGGSDLDMVITDETGNVICYDTTDSDQLYCDWVPAWDGPFYVTVENTGDTRNTYYIVTNI